MNIAVIGEYNPASPSHVPTELSIRHASQQLKMSSNVTWIPTDEVAAVLPEFPSTYDGCWIAPGSPYKSMEGALKAIQFTRLNRIPTIGTCGGFQHMAIEFARNVLGIREANHAEYDPYASKLVVHRLACSLVGKKLVIKLREADSLTRQAYQSATIEEEYYCNFGLNPAYQQQIDAAGFNVVGMDEEGEARILELKDHPFFIATLFVPQHLSTPERPHPLVTAFLKAVNDCADKKPGQISFAE